MNIVCVYDIAGPTSVKAMHILRKYLFHIQKSVFQGQLTPSKFQSLQNELNQISLKENDQILFFYTYRDGALYEKGIGKTRSPTNII